MNGGGEQAGMPWDATRIPELCVRRAEWLRGEGEASDVVMSSRVRLARNLDGVKFMPRAERGERDRVLGLCKAAILDSELSPRMLWVDLHTTGKAERQLLVERQLISRPHARGKLSTGSGGTEEPRGVAVGLPEEQFAIMVNEEDHLRIQALRGGSDIDAAFQQVRGTDLILEQQLDFAFSDRWGYLAVCPTNVGTGIRFSIMVHLPGLRITNELGKVRRAAKELHLAVRGYYGEGSESLGNIFQISNQVTLGSTEEDIRDIFTERIMPALIDYERSARQVLLKRNPTLLDDRVHRALNILRSARLLKVEEAMKLISRVRLGACLDRLDVPLHRLDDLFIQIQPAHLRQHVNCTLNDEEELEIRASLVREVLKDAD